MRIAVDAMGGDKAPEDVIAGVSRFLEMESDTEVLLVGTREILEPMCAGLNVTIIDSRSVVGMHESPSSAIKTKQDSSIAVSVQLVKNGAADALISMGNSGAAAAFALFGLGRLANISRPPIVAPMPNINGCTLLLDVGSTVDCKPKHLLHFAVMGSVYGRLAFNMQNPRVGILSIGEEKSKGNELTFEATKLLEQAPINFIGNVEGTDISRGTVDVVVCDGFVGNVILKYGEGLVEMFSRILSLETDEVLGMDVDDEHRRILLRETMARVDYTAYGAATLLGVNGHCLIGHGKSGPRAIANAIRTAQNAAEKCPIHEIQKALEEINVVA
ncbi:MAG: phosphate acyltransferase PlsX [bacterium]|jgi:glycerol-3-phosphate acyltransferase PlsX